MTARKKEPELSDPILGITTAWQYWAEVVQPSVLTYLETPTPRTAFGACMALWHLRDWVKAEPKWEQALMLGSANVAAVRDVITWEKHRQVSSSMASIEAVTEELDGMRLMAAAGFPPVIEHLAKFTVRFQDKSVESLEHIVKKAYLDWKAFFERDSAPLSV